MGQMQKEMQGFRAHLVKRAPRIKHNAYLKDLRFGPVQQNKFVVTATWGPSADIEDKKSGSLSFTFTSDMVYGHVGTRCARPKRQLCYYADGIIRAVLRARGVVWI